MRGEGSTPQVKWLRFWRLNGPSVVERGADSGTVHKDFPWITDAYTQKRLDRCTVGYSSVANLPRLTQIGYQMRNSRFCKTTAALGVAAFVSIAALVACGGSETESPSSTTPTPTLTPGVTPTEKGIVPTGGNSFSPPVSVRQLLNVGVPGTNHTG